MHLSPYIAAGLSHNHLMASIKMIRNNKIKSNVITQNESYGIANRIMLIVSDEFNISVDQMTSKCRTMEIKTPRQIAIEMIRRKSTLTLKQIGKLFNRDHTTVLSSIDTVTNLKRFDKLFLSKYDNILGNV